MRTYGHRNSRPRTLNLAMAGLLTVVGLAIIVRSPGIAHAEQASAPAGISRTWAGSMDAGTSNTCFVMTKTTAGGDNVRCLGDGGSGYESGSPTTELAIGTPVREVGAGDVATCVLLVSGAVRCFGTDTSGQLGGSSLASNVNLNGAIASQLSLGSFTACVVTTSARVRCWGSDSFGQRGGATLADDAPLPPVSLIRPGWYHTCAILTTGDVRCWGANAELQLGGGSLASNVDLGAGLTASALALGTNHTCAIVSSGGVKCWGRNNEGQVGIPFDGNNPAPTSVPLPAGLTATSIAAARYTSCATLSDGSVHCWGLGDYGQLAGTTSPADPIPLPAGSFATSVSVGPYHGCATVSTGAVYCWGYGPPAGLPYINPGTGNTTNPVPTLVDLNGDAVGPDVTPPSISLAPSAPSIVLPGSTTLTATASDLVGVARVEFYLNTNGLPPGSPPTLLGTDTTAPYEQVFSTFQPGLNGFSAKAFDAAGNTTTAYASVFAISPPNTAILSGPPALTNATSASFTIVASPSSASIECSLDGAAYAACLASYTVGEGAHTLSARAFIDAAIDPSPASYSWTVDTQAPVITITAPAAGASYPVGQVVTPSYSCVDPNLLSCVVTTPIDTTTVGNAKTFQVDASDNAGNTSNATRLYNVVALPGALSDDFNRANGPIANGWLGRTTSWVVDSLRIGLTKKFGQIWRPGAPLASSQFASVVLAGIDPGASEQGLVLRGQDTAGSSVTTDNYLAAWIAVNYLPASGKVLFITSWANGTKTRLNATISTSFSAGDEMSAAVVGSTVTVRKNGTVVGSGTLTLPTGPGEPDLRNAPGRIGLWGNATGGNFAAVRFDDFKGGAL